MFAYYAGASKNGQESQCRRISPSVHRVTLAIPTGVAPANRFHFSASIFAKHLFAPQQRADKRVKMCKQLMIVDLKDGCGFQGRHAIHLTRLCRSQKVRRRAQHQCSGIGGQCSTSVQGGRLKTKYDGNQYRPCRAASGRSLHHRARSVFTPKERRPESAGHPNNRHLRHDAAMVVPVEAPKNKR